MNRPLKIDVSSYCFIQGGMLPIVMGPRIENYERMLPPDSFLHVDNFTDVSALAEYIKYLDNNDDAYMR